MPSPSTVPACVIQWARSNLQDPPGLAPIFGPEPPPIPSHLRLPPRPAGAAAPALHNQGLVRVAYSDPATGVYLGSPSIAQLGADTLFIAHVSG